MATSEFRNRKYRMALTWLATRCRKARSFMSRCSCCRMRLRFLSSMEEREVVFPVFIVTVVLLPLATRYFLGYDHKFDLRTAADLHSFSQTRLWFVYCMQGMFAWGKLEIPIRDETNVCQYCSGGDAQLFDFLLSRR